MGGSCADHDVMDIVILKSVSFRLPWWFWKQYSEQVNSILYSTYLRSANFHSVLSSFSLFPYNLYISKLKAILTQALKVILGMGTYWSTPLQIIPSTH